jgi:spore coat protein U-like protein
LAIDRAHRAAALAAAAAAAALAAPAPAHALLCGTFLFPITISAPQLAFGSYNPGAVAADVATATVTIECSSPLDLLPSYTVSLSRGGAPSYAPRKMAFGAARLDYNIYTDAGHTTVWGDGTAGTQTQAYSTNVQTDTFSFIAYGQIPAGQYVQVGGYADTIVVTVTY